MRPLAFVVVTVSTIALFLFTWAAQPASISLDAINGILPFPGMLAIAAIGQTLVRQQGGIDLSAPGVVSLTVVLAKQLAR
ncbi:MAG: hypothetical protein ACYDHH_12765 [Solirubrobacteraceae bacterium]